MAIAWFKRKGYEIVCTESYLDVGLCMERDRDLKPTRVLARLFPYSTLFSYGAPEYGAVEKLNWINTGKFMSIEEWKKISYNKSTDQILSELGINKRDEGSKSKSMFFRWYRKKIAEAVKNKMCYMGSCPNEMEIILHIIAPKDYKRKGISHCGTDCHHTKCESYYRNENDIQKIS